MRRLNARHQLKLMLMSEEKRAQLIEWLQDPRLRHIDILELLWARFGVSSSMGGLSRFYQATLGRSPASRPPVGDKTLVVHIRVLQQDKVLGETELRVALAPAAMLEEQSVELKTSPSQDQGAVTFEASTRLGREPGPRNPSSTEP